MGKQVGRLNSVCGGAPPKWTSAPSDLPTPQTPTAPELKRITLAHYHPLYVLNVIIFGSANMRESTQAAPE